MAKALAEGPPEKGKVCRRLEMFQQEQERKVSDDGDNEQKSKCRKLSDDGSDEQQSKCRKLPNDDDDDDDDDDLTFVNPFGWHF